MSNPERGAVRPLWLAVGVMTCVIFGTTLNKCLTCGDPVNGSPADAEAAPVVRGDPIFVAKADPPPAPGPATPEAPAQPADRVPAQPADRVPAQPADRVPAQPGPDAPAEPAVTPGPKPPGGPLPGPPAAPAQEDEGAEPARTADLPTIEPRPPLRPLPKDPGPAPAPKDLREYVDLNFDKLASYTYELPEPGAEQKKDQIPASVRKLNDTKVSLKGFMIPLKTEGEDVLQFVLVRNQMACCFGIVPRINEWIHVRMAPGKAAPYALDIPVTVFGRLEVGEVYENGYIMSVYRLECDRVIEPPVYR